MNDRLATEAYHTLPNNKLAFILTVSNYLATTLDLVVGGHANISLF